MPGNVLLFHVLRQSTISAERLDCRVRDGIGYNTFAIITRQKCYSNFKKKNYHYAVVNESSISIIKLAKLFSDKVKYVPSRPGERFQSKVLNSIRGKKIHNIITKDKLVEFVDEFKNRN